MTSTAISDLVFRLATAPLTRLGLAIGGSWLLALSARIVVPMAPVPMTMQSLALLLIAAIYGRRLACETVLAYLAQGALGLPVFASGANGLAYMAGPTGGFLLGFVLTAALVGYFFDRGAGDSRVQAFAALTIGHFVLFVPGVLWLATYAGFNGAMSTGLVPFIPGTLVKVVLAFALLSARGRALPKTPRGA